MREERRESKQEKSVGEREPQPMQPGCLGPLIVP